MYWRDGVYRAWTPPAVGITRRFFPERGIF
jgi:hypothetical protein